MGYTPSLGTTWGLRFWLFIVVLASTVSLMILADLESPWYLKLRERSVKHIFPGVVI